MTGSAYLGRRAVALATDIAPKQLDALAASSARLVWRDVPGGDAAAPVSVLRSTLADQLPAHMLGGAGSTRASRLARIDELLAPLTGPTIGIDDAAARLGRTAEELHADIASGSLLAVWRRSGSRLEPELLESRLGAPLADAASGATGSRLRTLATSGARRGVALIGSAVSTPRSRVIAGGATALFLGGGAVLAATRHGSGASSASAGGAGSAARVTPPVGSTGATDQRTRLAAVVGAEADRNIRDVHPDGTLDERVAEYQRANHQSPSTHRSWPLDFVVWATAQAGMPVGPKGGGASLVADLGDWASDLHAFHLPKDHDPKVGDIVVLDLTKDEKARDNIGIVESVDPKTGHFTVVEGNVITPDKVGDVPVGIVGRLEYAKGDATVVGFIDPIEARANEAAEAAKPKPAPAPTPPTKPGHSTTGPTGNVRGAQMPNVSRDHPKPADVMQFIDWAAAQYATSPKQQRELANLLKNVAFRENGLKIHALNLWDSNAVQGIPSSGMFQYISPTFDDFKGKARSSNQAAWKQLGQASYTDWRSQALVTAWALAQTPTDFSKAYNLWSGQHGRYWSRWTSIKNMHAEGIDPTSDSYWKQRMHDPGLANIVDSSVDRNSTYPPGWRSSGKVYSHAQLTQMERTGHMRGLPFYPG